MRNVGGKLLILLMLVAGFEAQADSGFTYTGKILDAAGEPVVATSVRFTLTIYEPTGKCWLYTEQRELDLSNAAGTFSIDIGSNDSSLVAATAMFNGGASGPQNLSDVFNNAKSFSGLGASNGCTGTYTPNASEPNAGRVLSVYFTVDGGPNQALPALKINPVPSALQAYSVDGYGAGTLLKVASNVNTTTHANNALSQAQYDEFWRVIKNPLAAYLPTTGDVTIASGNNRVTTLLGQALPAGPATNNQVLVSNGTSWTLQSMNSGGGITNLNGLSSGSQTFAIGTSGNAPDFSSATNTHTLNIPMASGGTVTAGLISNTDYNRIGDAENINGKAMDTTAATTMGQMLFFDSVADKWKVSAAAAPTDGQIMKWNDTTKTWEPGNDTGGWTAVDASYAAKGIVQFDTNAATSGINIASGVANVVRTTSGTANTILALDGFGATNLYGIGILGAVSGSVIVRSSATSASYALTLPNTAPSAGQSLQSDGSGNLSWVSALNAIANTADLANSKIWVGNASGKAVEVSVSGDATISNTGVVTVDKTQTAVANKILQLDASSVANVKGVNATSDEATAYASSSASLKTPAGGVGVSVNNWEETSSTASYIKMNAHNGSGNDQYAYMGTVSTAGAGAWTPSIVFGQSTGSAAYSEAMRIHSNTFVGIGATAPATKLDVSGVTRSTGFDVNSTYGGNQLSVRAPASFSNYTLTLPVDDGAANQLLQTDGNGNLSWVASSVGADNLGNHTAAQNVQLGSHWLSGDGGNEGVRIDSTGRVGVGGVTAPNAPLDVQGTSAAQNDNGFANFRDSSNNGISIGYDDTAGRNWAWLFGRSAGVTPRPIALFAHNYNQVPDLIVDNAKVGIKTATPGAELDVKGVIRLSGSTSGYAGFQPAAVAGSTVWTLPTADGTAGQVLKTDGAGQLGWVSAAGGADNLGNHTATQNIQLASYWLSGDGGNEGVYVATDGKVGVGTSSPGKLLHVNGDANINTILIGKGGGGVATNTILAVNGLANNSTGTNLTAIGYNALQTNGAGSNNSALGALALSANDGGNNNTGVGYSALTANATGGLNTAVGAFSLATNNSGNNNTAIGYQALYTSSNGVQNTAVGSFSLATNGSGHNNSAVGYFALNKNTGGLENSAVGYYAHQANTTGNKNVALGSNALYSSTAGSGNVAVGGDALYDYNNTTNGLYTYNTAIGYNTGRGITTGTGNTIIGAQVTGLAAGLTNNIILADGAGNRRINIDSSGNVGIGTTSPRSKLDVQGGAITGAPASTDVGAGPADFSLGNVRYTSSDCGSFALHNLKDGSHYSFVVKGATAATCTFTAFSDAGSTALTVHMPADNGNTIASKHTVFSLLVAGSDVYVAWVTGL